MPRRRSDKYTKIMLTLPDNQQVTFAALCDTLTATQYILDQAFASIKSDGAIIKAKNGNGFVVLRENPACKIYNSTLKTYNDVVRQIIGVIETYAPKMAGNNTLIADIVKSYEKVVRT